MILNTKSVKANTQGYIEKGTITNEIFNEVVPNEVTLDMKEAKWKNWKIIYLMKFLKN